ncbi:Glycogen synthase [Urbifossiella limnaea]|uniref:Glycogen synthase n=1 Tax=Urbifossiella limnaea TaxID=2528023 RepID=A0A517XVZ8_9BACT|nr:glycogen synthase GlgA [Urbifossiella limnaea]QDU21688.1 Glycogen synthase [Urbifossiella limnaea]
MGGLRILVASSEVAGLAKTGGLADVAASLPRALAGRGHQVAVVMPYYAAVRRTGTPVEKTGIALPVPLGGRTLACRLLRTRLPNSDVPVYLVEHPPFFERDDGPGRGLYQQGMPGGYKADYPDNAERFTFFSRAVLEAVPFLGFTPDVIHANDWQTGLVPVFLNEAYRTKPAYKHVRSLFTIHNIAYQGTFGPEVMKLTGLPGWLLNPGQLEFHGYLNFLKAGIVFADAVNTVSPTYAREITTPDFGCGLDGLLRGVSGKLSGIVNGCDYADWDPANDRHIAAKYTADTVTAGKAACKADLQKRFNLPQKPDVPVLGMVARLVSQKGVDLVLSAAPGFLDLGCQLVFLGDGDPEYHDELNDFKARHPDKVGVFLGFNEGLAHAVEAGSDLFLMPSRYEPCGLNQLYSLRYGTAPVVRATGGLADTVVNATEEHLKAGTATGFSFGEFSARALYETVKWALSLYRTRPADFAQVVRTAMAQDWGWDRSAAEYEALYRKVSRVG